MFLNATGVGHVILGASASVMVQTVANAYIYNKNLGPGDEIIIAEANHEANANSWRKAADVCNATIRVWPFNRETFETCPLDSLLPLLNSNTKLVCFPHASNVIGEVVDLAGIVRAVKERAPNAKTFVDGVAYAPHLVVDVKQSDVDWYVYSWYKQFGGHSASLYGKYSSFDGLVGPNHFFMPADLYPWKWTYGCLNYETLAGRYHSRKYLNVLAGEPADAEPTRATLEAAFRATEELERPLLTRLLAFLQEQTGVTVYQSGRGARLSTVSFSHATLTSHAIAAELHRHKIMAKADYFGSYNLVQAFGTPHGIADGVVRISFAHYNTLEEVEKIVRVLSALLSGK